MTGERSRKAREANERRSREKAEARRRRERAAARANTAPAGGRTQTWETAQPGKKKTANDYYEEKRKKREKDRKEIDAAFSKAMEETQKMLRERDLGLIDHLDRSTGDTVYNQNYYDLFGMPEGGKDFNRRVERTRNWDKLTDSGKYDRMVYIQEEQERRRKGIPESTGMVYNKGNAGRGTQEGRGPEENKDAVWSGPYRIGKPEGISEQEWLAMDAKGRLRAVHKGEGRKARDAWNAGERKPREGSADTKGYDAWEALAEAAGKMGTDEGTLREYLAGNPGITLPNGLNAEKMRASGRKDMVQSLAAETNNGHKQPGYEDAPDELKRMYDILGEGDSGKGISFEGLEESFGREMNFELDNEGNIIGDYREAIKDRIEEQYPDVSEKDRNDLLEGTLLFLRAEHDKQNADPEKVVDVTDKYQEMIEGSMNNPVWQTEMLGFGPFRGKYYLKDDPQKIEDLCGDQIPKDIMDEAKRIGGVEGVSYLMQEGYGYFRVGDKIMNAEELGNYSLGVIATKKGYSKQEGYGAASIDAFFQWLKNFGKKGIGSAGGEIYDKYYQTMGMNDKDEWMIPSKPNMLSHKL